MIRPSLLGPARSIGRVRRAPRRVADGEISLEGLKGIDPNLVVDG
jgi:hypothetical protein